MSSDKGRKLNVGKKWLNILTMNDSPETIKNMRSWFKNKSGTLRAEREKYEIIRLPPEIQTPILIQEYKVKNIERAKFFNIPGMEEQRNMSTNPPTMNEVVEINSMVGNKIDEMEKSSDVNIKQKLFIWKNLHQINIDFERSGIHILDNKITEIPNIGTYLLEDRNKLPTYEMKNKCLDIVYAVLIKYFEDNIDWVGYMQGVHSYMIIFLRSKSASLINIS